MAHVRNGKTAKRQRRYGALDRLRVELDQSDKLLERRISYGKEPTALQIIYRVRIKAEIKALESRI